MKKYLEKHVSEESENEAGLYAKTFFKYYDKKIASGEITYKELKMDQNDFMSTCTDNSFIIERSHLIELCDKMKLEMDEAIELIQSAGYIFKDEKEME